MLFVYVLVAIFFRKHYVVLILSIIQIVSLFAVIVIGLDDYSDEDNTIENVIAILFMTLLFILPWRNYHEIEGIKTQDRIGVNKIANTMLVIGGFVFVILLIVALIVNVLISDINTFKYEDGASIDFFYKMLPFNVKFFIIAYSLYYISYFFIPLHFYFLHIGDVKRGKLCLLFSLNIILFGLTFFSRWTITLYALLFAVHWVIYNKLIPPEIRVQEKKLIKYSLVFLLSFFVFISISRFTDNYEYEKRMSTRSMVQDPTLYSFFDYLGKSNSNGIFQMNKYNGRTFNGGFMFWTLQDMLSVIGITKQSDMTEKRDDLWGDKSRSFTCFAVYTIYDVGYMMSFVLGLMCFLYIKQNGRYITFDKFIVSSLLLQLPLCSIFYSQMPVVVVCLFIFLFVKIYLIFRNLSIKKRPSQTIITY